MAIQIPYRGIIEITGDHDVGKTIAALQVSNNMKDIVFVDDDVKGEGTVRQMHEAGMEFEEYIDLAPRRLKLGNTPTADELLQYVVLPTIEQIVKKKHKIIVWDTWRIVYQSARGHVERNQHKYSSVVNFRGSSQIIQGLISKVARMIELQQLNKLKEACDLLIITHHVKDNYVANVAIGKVPESSATFSEICNMRLWLRRNQKSKVPIILFLKRPNIPKLVKGKLQFVNIVPLKITPSDKHDSIWDAIAEYEANPIQSRQPRIDETPTQEELMAISGVLTPEMQTYIKTMVEYNLKVENELVEAIKEQREETAKKYSTETNKAPVDQKADEITYPENGIQLIARAKVELDYELADIEKIVGKSFGEINAEYKTDYWNILQASKRNEEIKDKKGKK